MSEQVPKITQEDIVYAWNAAQAANEAFDGVQEAGTSIDMLGVFEQAGVQFVNIQETREAFDTDYDNAVANHRFQVAKAAPVMLLPRSPFAQNKPTPEAEPAPDLKESILEQLLPAHDAYVTVTDQLNRGRCNNIERIELVNITTAETELHGFLSQEKMRYLTAATEADPELRFTLVATPTRAPFGLTSIKNMILLSFLALTPKRLAILSSFLSLINSRRICLVLLSNNVSS
jgi:hypothetical protein